MAISFNARFKSGQMTVMLIRGIKQFKNEAELQEESNLLMKVPEIEADLEKLTGLRVHIEQTGTVKEDLASIKPSSPTGKIEDLSHCPDCGQEIKK